MHFNKLCLLSGISLTSLFFSVLWSHTVFASDALTMISATLLEDRASIRVVMSSDVNGSTLGVTDFNVDGVTPDSVDETEAGVISFSKFLYKVCYTG